MVYCILAAGVSRAKNLLMSEDVIASIDTIKKLGIKLKLQKIVKFLEKVSMDIITKNIKLMLKTQEH